MVVKEKSMRSDDIIRLTANKNVSIRVCAIALKNQHYEPTQLLSGVKTVPDGIYEIISKQREGWGYIKVAH
jgi:intracellular sulfur oxidation DsrE/DsrF family protein